MAELNENVSSRTRGCELVRTADDVVYVTDAISTSCSATWPSVRPWPIGVLFLFLRSLPATLIGAIGIPICTIAAFLGL